MPIFHGHHEPPSQKLASPPSTYNQRHGAGYAGDDSGGTFPENMHLDTAMDSGSRPSLDPVPVNDAYRPCMINRVELIERIKRSNSPAWSQYSTVSLKRGFLAPGGSRILTCYCRIMAAA